ncbi:hypothetical protein BDN71DRAFT_1453268 [Pleurotus eryngii]|uniref:Uncharacterized protein n=1 Tax=Pleurotus eryngii TaxID=5323 RepID=A0A9P6D4Y5_PLEER|nr:hypothetical protein BDN71DRAFT_1453268 [Pleurotus eryngii]
MQHLLCSPSCNNLGLIGWAGCLISSIARISRGVQSSTVDLSTWHLPQYLRQYVAERVLAPFERFPPAAALGRSRTSQPSKQRAVLESTRLLPRSVSLVIHPPNSRLSAYPLGWTDSAIYQERVHSSRRLILSS